jgi:hypothetical protein
MTTPLIAQLVNRSGSIASGGTAQDIYAANAAPRFYLLVQNVSDEDLWVDFDRDAAANTGILIKAGTAWEPLTLFTGRLSIFGATTGKYFVCKTA